MKKGDISGGLIYVQRPRTIRNIIESRVTNDRLCEAIPRARDRVSDMPATQRTAN